MKILITGGAGFIGRWLLRELPPDADIVVVDRLDEQTHGPNPEFPADVLARAHCIRCDVRDVDRWKNAAAGVEVVVHLAALTGSGQSMYQQERYLEHNVLGTGRLCEALMEMRPRPRRVILASSRAVYGEGAYRDGPKIVYAEPRQAAALGSGHWEVENSDGVALNPLPIREDAPLQPTSIYGMTKMWQEQLLTFCANKHGIEYLVLRLQNVYGPLQSLDNPYTGIIGLFATGIIRGGGVELFEDGEMTRDLTFVGDVARALVAGVYHPGRLTCALNFGSGIRVSLRDLIGMVARMGNKEPLVICRGRYRLGDIRHASADMSAYQMLFGSLHLTTLEEGMRDYLRWFLKQPAPAAEAQASSLAEMERHGLLLAAQ